MSSTTHVEEDKKQLAKDMHRLARSRVRLKDSNEGGVVVMNMYESSLVSKVKDKKDQHPVLLELKENVLKKKVMALEKRGMDCVYQRRMNSNKGSRTKLITADIISNRVPQRCIVN